MQDYKKYRWFYTSTGKLIVGGKNSDQNDTLLKNIKEDYMIMHTSAPGSPFTVIISPVRSVKTSDLKEAAIFTACFSQAWKSGKKEASIDIFRRSQLQKNPLMKSGTWGVLGKVQKMKVTMELALTIQKDVLRAVPLTAAEKNSLRIIPGKTDKTKLVDEIKQVFKNISSDQILSALPAGGIKIK